MKKFSERHGHKKVSIEVQKTSMDSDLKTAIWNAIHIYFLSELKDSDKYTDWNYLVLRFKLWIYYLKRKADEEPDNKKFVLEIKWIFENKLNWYEIYDLIEFIIQYHSGPHTAKINNNFTTYLNTELELHNSAYRIIEGIVTPIDSEEEIKSLQESLDSGDKYNAVKNHLKSAISLMSDKKNPDYRNSIKESISAVEALCCIIVGKKTSTLSQALKEIEKKHNIHPTLKSSFDKLYAYTNDTSGIRHKLLDEDSHTRVDAKFMLVSCSSFINYLIQKNDI
jgi:hypothetical protein